MPGSSFSAVRAVSMVASNRGTSGASMITATWTSSEPKGASQCSGALGPTSPSSSARAAMPWRNSGAKVSSDSCSTPSAPNPAYVNPTLKEVSVAGWCTSWTTSARRSASVRPSRGSSMRRSRKAPAYGVGRPRKTPAWMSSSSSVMVLSPVMVSPEAVVDRTASRVPLFTRVLRRGILRSSFAECCVRPPARPHTCSTLPLCDQDLEQPVEVGLGRLHKHPSGAACSDSYRKLPSGVRPALHRLPVHAAQLRERASQRVEHHRDCGAELGTHPRHLVWHVHRSLEVDQASVTVELASGYDAL